MYARNSKLAKKAADKNPDRWRVYPLDERFVVSVDGKVVSFESGKAEPVKPRMRRGVPRVNIGNSVHQLQLVVARTWIFNEQGFQAARFIDGDVHNAHVDNIEWCKHSESDKYFKRLPTAEALVKKLAEEEPETWRVYPVWPKWAVNVSGEIVSFSSGKRYVKRAYLTDTDILMVRLPDNRGKAVSRVVAETWLPNPENLPDVRYLDLDRSNVSASNLEWCSRDARIRETIELGLWSDKKAPTPVKDLLTGKLYPSLMSASRAVGLSAEAIRRHVNGNVSAAKTRFVLDESLGR